MNECDHLCGLSTVTARHGTTGETIASWTEEVRHSHLRQAHLMWAGPEYKFCPECGFDLKEIHTANKSIRYQCSTEGK